MFFGRASGQLANGVSEQGGFSARLKSRTTFDSPASASSRGGIGRLRRSPSGRSRRRRRRRGSRPRATRRSARAGTRHRQGRTARLPAQAPSGQAPARRARRRPEAPRTVRTSPRPGTRDRQGSTPGPVKADLRGLSGSRARTAKRPSFSKREMRTRPTVTTSCLCPSRSGTSGAVVGGAPFTATGAPCSARRTTVPSGRRSKTQAFAGMPGYLQDHARRTGRTRRRSRPGSRSSRATRVSQPSSAVSSDSRSARAVSMAARYVGSTAGGRRHARAASATRKTEAARRIVRLVARAFGDSEPGGQT